ncbi:hypothetical protein [Blattabacterium sp. (Cryptocercus kyebangensis)]|uniref:hypothetical protein n=1 Tax=Blattabacterium sp. (Cryptocercus kyebangensis) TaxID=298656 RepID=UPI001F1B0302|nr:hypothetical protein [Blattabacterium sp. (Cryptocercus kyebangensis)]
MRRFSFFLTGFIIGILILYYSYRNTSTSYHQKILNNNIKNKKIIIEINKNNIQKCKKNTIFCNPIFIKSNIFKKGNIFFQKKLFKEKPFPMIYYIEIIEKNNKKIFIIEEQLETIIIKKII